jgi:hypothetical protein
VDHSLVCDVASALRNHSAPWLHKADWREELHSRSFIYAGDKPRKIALPQKLTTLGDGGQAGSVVAVLLHKGVTFQNLIIAAGEDILLAALFLVPLLSTIALLADDRRSGRQLPGQIPRECVKECGGHDVLLW